MRLISFADGNQDIYSGRELGCHGREPLRDFVRKAMFEGDVAAFDVPQCPKAIDHRREIRPFLLSAAGAKKHSYSRNPYRLLRASKPRPCDRPTDESNKVPPPNNTKVAHSITKPVT